MNLGTRLSVAYKALTTRSEVSLAGAMNLFGSIATEQIGIGSGFGFVPRDGEGGTIDLTANMQPAWLGLNSRNMQFWAYNYCSPLAAVIDRLAEADTNGRIGMVDEDGVPIKNINKNPRYKRVMSLLKRPNPMQTWEEFNSQQIVLCKIFGYCPVFAICPLGQDKSFTKYLWNLNPYFAIPQYNYDFSFFGEEIMVDGARLNKSNPIKEWHINIFGSTYTIPSEDILLVKDGFVDNLLPNMGLPISKVAGLDYSVSNICAAMEADNVLLKKKGPLGVFSYDPKPDMAGSIPLNPNDKQELQDELARYGLTVGQLQYIISKKPLKWNAMSFNLRDLMTKETVRQGIDSICDRFGYPAELMSGKNATYENRNSAEKYLYQNNIIPFSIRRMSRYNTFFNLDEVGASLSLDYNHLPVLQEDIMKAGQARKAMSESLVLDWESGLITFNEYRKLSNLDEVAGMDIYYPDWLKLNPTIIPDTKTIIA